MNINIRPADMEHLEGIHSLVERNSSPHALLPRSKKSIEETLGDWLIALQGSEIIACGSLMAYRDNLAEIRSLAVESKFRGIGIGRKIVEELISIARHREVKSIFALTRAAHLFHTCGFQTVPIECFPEKVMTYCKDCPNRENCDETAVVMQLVDEPFKCRETSSAELPHINMSILTGAVLLVR